MTGAAQGVAGLAVALGFALVGARRTGGVALLCAAQAVVVASGALAQGDAGVAVVELVEAGLLAWWAGRPATPPPLEGFGRGAGRGPRKWTVANGSLPRTSLSRRGTLPRRSLD